MPYKKGNVGREFYARVFPKGAKRDLVHVYVSNQTSMAGVVALVQGIGDIDSSEININNPGYQYLTYRVSNPNEFLKRARQDPNILGVMVCTSSDRNHILLQRPGVSIKGFNIPDDDGPIIYGARGPQVSNTHMKTEL